MGGRTVHGTKGWARRLLPALAVVVLAAGCRKDRGEDFAVEPVRPAPALEAPRASGGVFRLSEQRGKVVVLSFGYTACPDVCPTTLSQLQRLHSRLGEAARDVEVVFVSVDPERDSAQQLETYVHAFNPRFTGLRLDAEALAPMLSAWRVTATRRYPDAARYREHTFTGDMPYTVDHTGAFFLVDKAGALRARMPYTVSVERLQQEVERLLKEDGAAGVRVEKARARLTPARVGAVYLTLVNTSGREDRLIGAESATAGKVELHEVIAQGELLQMHPRPEGFVVPAKGRVDLAPGGKHLMLYAVQASPASLPLTLHFEKAGTVHLTVPVSAPGADEP
ncbi:SCO family protein [Archangium gephyra]|uniref:SCO family protein n=1 Tax=Archangium gephyra TaxID=48 RepID=UPI003B7DF2F1